MRRPIGVAVLVSASVVAFWVPAAAAATEAPAVWAKGTCTAVVAWVSVVDTILEDASPAATADAPADARAVLVRTLRKLERRTNKLVKAIERGGVPDVDGGKAALNGFVEVFTTVADGLGDTRAQIADAPDDPAGLATAIRTASQDLQALLVQANLDFSEVDVGGRQLQRAVKKAPACQELFA